MGQVRIPYYNTSQDSLPQKLTDFSNKFGLIKKLFLLNSEEVLVLWQNILNTLKVSTVATWRNILEYPKTQRILSNFRVV